MFFIVFVAAVVHVSWFLLFFIVVVPIGAIDVVICIVDVVPVDVVVAGENFVVVRMAVVVQTIVVPVAVPIIFCSYFCFYPYCWY